MSERCRSSIFLTDRNFPECSVRFHCDLLPGHEGMCLSNSGHRGKAIILWPKEADY